MEAGGATVSSAWALTSSGQRGQEQHKVVRRHFLWLPYVYLSQALGLGDGGGEKEGRTGNNTSTENILSEFPPLKGCGGRGGDV